MASASCSFSALLNSSNACGLSSDYPGQVEAWVLECTKKAYRFNEKQKAYLDAKCAIGQTTGKKLDSDIVAREMRRALGPDGVCLFKVSEFHSKSCPTSCVVQPRSAHNFPMMPISGEAKKQTTLLEQEKLPWPLHSTIPSPLISPIFAPWPRVDNWTTNHAAKHLSETGIRDATQAFSL